MGLKVNTIESVSGGPVSIPEVNIASGMSIPSWTPATSYVIGNIVRRNNTIYLITANHTSQAVSNNFYIDWLTNGYLTPMSSAPGDIIYKVGAPDAGLLLLDGSEKLITTYPDLYHYLYNFVTPNSYNFSENGVGNTVTNNGYAYFNIAGHGLSSGDMVYITLDTIGSPTFAYANKPYFVQVLDVNHFCLSTENWEWTTNSGGAVNRLMYTPGMFGNASSTNTIYKTYWGHSLNPSTHFMLPDFRGLMVRNAGTNGYMVKYNRSSFNSILGQYKSDTGLNHSHNYVAALSGALCVNGVDYPRADNNTLTSDGVNENRANETEFAPAHVVVNAYIRF
jgi:hypothetical protein